MEGVGRELWLTDETPDQDEHFLLQYSVLLFKIVFFHKFK